MTRLVTLLSIDISAPDTAVELLGLMNAVSAIGVATRVATGPQELDKALRDDGRAIHVLVLDGLDNPACNVLQLIARMKMHRHLGIMVAVKSHAQRLLAQAAGADVCYRLPLRRQDFLADVSELLDHYARPRDAARRSAIIGGEAPSAPPQAPGLNVATAAGAARVAARQARKATCWRLAERGWVLITPYGYSIPLLARERVFLMALFESEDKRLTRGQWMQLSTKSVDTAKAAYTLSAIAFGLRSKCALVSDALPLRSERARGYLFTGACLIERQETASAA